MVSDGLLWKKLIERKVKTDPIWKGLSERKGWKKYLFRHVPTSEGITHMYYRQLYPNIIKDIEVSRHCVCVCRGWMGVRECMGFGAGERWDGCEGGYGYGASEGWDGCEGGVG